MVGEVLLPIFCWGTNSDDGGSHLLRSLSQHCAEVAVLSEVKPKLQLNLQCLNGVT